MGRFIWSVVTGVAVLLGAFADAGLAQGDPEAFPDAQSIAAVSTCLHDSDGKRGILANRCVDLVARPCRNLPGQTTNDVATCSLTEAQIWAGLLDHELGQALQAARATDLLCATARNGTCPKARDYPGQVEVALRRSQRDWVQMLTSTCDYAWKSYGEATARLTFYASCVRDLVFARQQLFWQVRTQGDGRNADPAAADLRYEGEVVPFAFRPSAE